MPVWRAPLFLLAVATVAAGEWQTGTVVFSRYQFRNDLNTAGAPGGMIQTGYERFELRTANGTVYDVEEWVAPKKLLRLPDGTKLQFAVEGRKIVVRAPDGTTRKLKIVAKDAQNTVAPAGVR